MTLSASLDCFACKLQRCGMPRELQARSLTLCQPELRYVLLQIKTLVQAGYRVIAPDLRGALGGESDAPQEPAAYSLPNVIVRDVAGVAPSFTSRSDCCKSLNTSAAYHYQALPN